MALPLVALPVERLKALQRRETDIGRHGDLEVAVQTPLADKPSRVAAVFLQQRRDGSGAVSEHGRRVARGKVTGVKAGHQRPSRRCAHGKARVRVAELEALGGQPRDARRDEPTARLQRARVRRDVAVAEVILWQQ
eukprot:COSAG06_NODE_3604_length_5131_cov_1.935612_3_plen_136_part_00